MTLSKQQTLSILRSLTCALCAAVLAWGGQTSNVYADADSISINFSSDRNGNQASPTGGNLGAFPVNYQYWNNVSGASGTNVPLISNTGAATGVSGTWSSNNTWDFNATKPSTDNNAILYYGYLDDGGNHASFSMKAPYFTYDVYYYAATDSTVATPHRYVAINNVNYCGGSYGTVLGSSHWGTRVAGNISSLTEGVNYLRASSTDSQILVQGAANDNNHHRGSFGALQIVNTANSQSTTTGENSLTLANATWNNDLTGATGEGFNASADGYRILYTGTEETFTVDLNGNLPNIKLIGAATNLAFTGTVTQLGKTNTVTDLTKMGTTVSAPNIAQVAPQGAVKLGSNTTFTELPTAEDSIPGAYYVDGSTVSFAKIAKIVNDDETVNYVLAPVVPTYQASPTDGMDLNVTDKITDNATRTLNSLTSTKDYLNSQSLTITSGMMMFNNSNHWVQGGGTITSGYQNADGEYDLYLCAVGTANDMRVDNATIVDNPSGKLNLIKTGTGMASITRAPSANTYSGKTVVLEGKLLIGESIRSTEFYVASGAELDLASIPYNGNNGGWEDLTFTATKLSGYGTVQVGNNDGRIALNLQGVTNDGSKLSRVNAYGRALTMNNSALNANLVNSQTLITLNNSTITADTFNSCGNTTVIFDATSTLNAAAFATSAGALTLDIPANRSIEISKPITGAGGFVKDGAGKLTLSQNNTFTGGTTVNNGTLELTVPGGTGTLAPGAAVTVDGETSVLAGHGDILGYTTGAIGSLTLKNGGTLYNDQEGTHITVNNVVNMNGGTIAANGVGTQDATYGNGNFIFDNAIHVTPNTNDQITNQITADGIVFRTLPGTTFATGDSAGLIDVADGATLTISSAIGNYSASDYRTDLTKAGAGELVLTGTSKFFNSFTINGGVVDLTNGAIYAGAYAGNAHVYVNDGGTLKVNNFGYSEAGASSLGGLTYSSYGSTNIHLNGGTIQVAESYGDAIARKIELQANGGTLDLAEGVELTLSDNINGAGALTKAGAGTLELTYANEYTGGTTISQGEVNLSGAGTLGMGAVAIAQNAVLNLNHDGSARFDNSVSGSGKIYKNGNGVLKIYNPTEDAFAAESFVVNAGKLDFKGYFKGALEIGDGAVFSPGNSIGTLTIDGPEVDPQMSAFSLDSGSTLLMEVGYDENNVWTSDKLVVNGSVYIDPNSTIILTLLEGTALPTGEFTIDLISGPLVTQETRDAFESVLSAPYFKDYSIELNGGVIQLTASIDPNAVPEPSTWALLVLGVVALFLRKRVRK